MSVWVVSAISVLILILGLWGGVRPSGVAAWALRWQSRAGFSMAVVFRILFGAALWLAAPASQAPAALRVLGGLTAASGLALALMGLGRYQSLLSWWSRRPPGLIRAWCLLAAGLGAFLLWAVSAGG